MRNAYPLSQLLLALVGSMAMGIGSLLGQNIVAPAIRLDFKIVSKGQALKVNAEGISRMDFLISELALQDLSGKWLPSEEWFAFISAKEERLQADTLGSPKGEFKAVRFRVGVDEKADYADPTQWPPGHPLHPDVNHLHWGWKSGYVHLAVEGKSSKGPFSYHLAGQENPMFVELPVRFSGGGPVTLGVELNVDPILSAASGPDAANATHSRPGDQLAVAMKAKAIHAFRSTGVSYDLFQSTRPDPQMAKPIPEGTRPYTVNITRRFPQVSMPADNPLTEEGVALGKRLFFDPILSINGTQSCSSCHQPEHGFSDPRRVSLGAEGQMGKRNSMAITNLAWAHSGLFWDGRAKTLREQVLMPIVDPTEMGESLENVLAKLKAEPSYPAEFKKAHGEEISADTLAKSLEQFLLTLVSQDSKFDRAVRKQVELTQEEKQGLSLFVTEHEPARGLRGADCFHCHGGTLFTDNLFHNNGLKLDDSDIGLMAITGNPSDRGKFRTPSLRNISATGPYMHDGRFATLEEVVAHYNSGIVRTETLDPNLGKHPAAGLRLNETEQKALVAFLKTLAEPPAASAPDQNASAQAGKTVPPESP